MVLPHRPLLRAAALLALAALPLGAQETPVTNRVVWFRIFPEPLPEASDAVALEASSQFLCTGQETKDNGTTVARLDGEDWQLTGDLAFAAGPGRFNLRVRGVESSGGIGDQAVLTYHRIFGFPGGGRGQVPNGRLDYRLVVKGRPVAVLDRSGGHLLATDLAYVLPFGDRATGARVGASVQLPTGDDRNWSSDGGVNALVGAAAWRTWGRFRLHAQVEGIRLGLPADSPFRAVIPDRTFGRVWAGLAYRDEGPGWWRGFQADVTLQYHPSPYRVGLAYIDRPGIQQHWVFGHRALPHWRFGFSEDAGNATEPDVTLFAVYRFQAGS